jgi:transposase
VARCGCIDAGLPAAATDRAIGEAMAKRNDRIKLLAWDGSGMVLATKWLESGEFVWPPVVDGAICLSSTQLALLLDGLAWSQAAAPS